VKNNIGAVYYMGLIDDRIDNLENAIATLKEALGALDPELEPQEWAKNQLNLSSAYIARVRGNRVENIEEGIMAAESALRIFESDKGSQNWVMVQLNLCCLYFNRRRGERLDNFEKAIVFGNAALADALTHDFRELSARTLCMLADVYSRRMVGEPPENVRLAIHYYERALVTFSRDNFALEWARASFRLGGLYMDPTRGRHSEDIERGLALCTQALQILTPKDTPGDWADCHHSLGVAYLHRFEGERASNIELAIESQRAALTVWTREDLPDLWAIAQSDLGEAFRRRVQGDAAQNTEQAIEYKTNALSVMKPDRDANAWAVTHLSLATAYLERKHGNRSENLERALKHCRESETFFSPTNYQDQWARLEGTLALIYAERTKDGRAQNVEWAIEHSSRALSVLTKEHFPDDWARCQNNLALQHMHRLRGKQEDNLAAAIGHFHSASQIWTRERSPSSWAQVEQNLGFAISRVRSEANRVEALAHYNNALGVLDAQNFPSQRRQALIRIGNLYFREAQWAEALNPYEEAWELGKQIIAAAYTDDSRRAESSALSRLHATTSFCLIKLGRLEEALVRLEQGKTRLLNEALNLAGIDSAPLTMGEREELRKARDAMRALQREAILDPGELGRRSDDALGEALRVARRELDQVISRSRSVHPVFLPDGLSLTEILRVAPSKSVLIAPFATVHGTYVFVLPGGSMSVTADNLIFVNIKAREWGDWLLGTPDHPAVLLRNPFDDPGWGQSLQDLTQWLWGAFLLPIATRIKSFGLSPGVQLIFLPDGPLGLAPLHAAWRTVKGEPRTLLDEYTISHAPSAFSLSATKSRCAGGAKLADDVLLVTNPTLDLAGAETEGQVIAGIFSNRTVRLINGDAATKDAVMLDGARSGYVHFACHGAYDPYDVMSSGLILANHVRLTLRDILGELQLDKTRLVVLSACTTGLIDFMQIAAEEQLGLPAALLQSGSCGVVATLWPVDDEATTLLVAKFYRGLYQGEKPHEALREAQLWLRDSTLAEFEAYFATHLQVHLSEDLASRFLEDLSIRGDKGNRIFNRPYYWAPFVFVGI
jgi:CHAT domain-containing protein/tetratricopeptide (TPR) repeat protein